MCSVRPFWPAAGLLSLSPGTFLTPVCHSKRLADVPLLCRTRTAVNFPVRVQRSGGLLDESPPLGEFKRTFTLGSWMND